MSARPPVPGTAQQHALTSLRRLVVAGDLKPGQRVNQEDVAEHIGLSVAPIREALRALEQEGQVTYLPRRGYFVTELRIEDLEEIYDLRALLEERAARQALPGLDGAILRALRAAARECVAAAETGDVAAELDANRRFHFLILDAPGRPHQRRLLGLLWDSTEAYRALYYNAPPERAAANAAHDRIVAAVAAGDGDRLIRELNEHRERALTVLRRILAVTTV